MLTTSRLATRVRVDYQQERGSEMGEQQPSQERESEMGEQQPSQLRPDNVFGRVMALGMSPEFLTSDRLTLIRKISQDLARDPAMLAIMERLLHDYADDIRRVVPTERELESLGLTGLGSPVDPNIAPVAAAAAVAPGAAAMAAGPAVFSV